MSKLIKIAVRTYLGVLFTTGTAVAQSRAPTELARGWPYSSDHWSWGPFIFLFALVITLGIAGAVQKVLRDEHWSHTFVVMTVTLLVALTLAAKVTAYPDFWSVVFMLIPSIIGVGLLYLGIMSQIQRRRDRQSR
jgi:hypothetical protein